MVTAAQLEAIKKHITDRFALLKRMLENNPSLRVVIAGVAEEQSRTEGKKETIGQPGKQNFYNGARGHRLGTGLAHDQWDNNAQWLEIVQHIDEQVNSLFSNERYGTRVSCGQVGESVSGENAVSKNVIHVWGANAGNWNLDDGKQITGGGQAAVIGKQRPGVFGIVTTPHLFNQQKLEAEWLYEKNWNPKAKATQTSSTPPTAPVINTRYLYQDGGDEGKFDLVNTISAYALEAGFGPVDKSPQRLYKRDNKLVGILPAAAAPETAFSLGVGDALKEMIGKIKNGDNAQIFLPVNVGKNHWTMLEMNFNKNNDGEMDLTSHFYDSAGASAINLSVLQGHLNQIMEREVSSITSSPCAQQLDGSSCGPIACWYAGQRIGGKDDLSSENFPSGCKDLRGHQAQIVLKHFPEYVIGGPVSLVPRPPAGQRTQNTPNRLREQRVVDRRASQQPQLQSANKKRTLSDFKIENDEVLLTTNSSDSAQQEVVRIEKLTQENTPTWEIKDGRVVTTAEYRKQWMSYYANTTRHADPEAIKKKIGDEIEIDSAILTPSPNLIKVLSVVALQAKKEREEKVK